jgi:hypothetical protein
MLPYQHCGGIAPCGSTGIASTVGCDLIRHRANIHTKIILGHTCAAVAGLGRGSPAIAETWRQPTTAQSSRKPLWTSAKRERGATRRQRQAGAVWPSRHRGRAGSFPLPSRRARHLDRNTVVTRPMRGCGAARPQEKDSRFRTTETSPIRRSDAGRRTNLYGLQKRGPHAGLLCASHHTPTIPIGEYWLAVLTRVQGRLATGVPDFARAPCLNTRSRK